MTTEGGARRAAGSRMMALTCRNVQHLQDAYLDGDLPASMSAEVDAHLLQCPECQRQYELLRACGNVIARDHSEPRPADDFAMRIMAALPKQAAATQPVVILTRRQRRRIILERIAAGAVPAIAAMVALFVLIYPATRPTEQHRVLGAAESRQAVDALGVRSLVDPALGTLNDTNRAAGNLGGLARMTLEQAREQIEAGARAAETPLPDGGALLMELLHPLMSVLQPPPGANPTESTDDDVRF
jgi:anti-sigma factor RsiW